MFFVDFFIPSERLRLWSLAWFEAQYFTGAFVTATGVTRPGRGLALLLVGGCATVLALSTSYAYSPYRNHPWNEFDWIGYFSSTGAWLAITAWPLTVLTLVVFGFYDWISDSVVVGEPSSAKQTSGLLRGNIRVSEYLIIVSAISIVIGALAAFGGSAQGLRQLVWLYAQYFASPQFTVVLSYFLVGKMAIGASIAWLVLGKELPRWRVVGACVVAVGIITLPIHFLFSNEEVVGELVEVFASFAVCVGTFFIFLRLESVRLVVRAAKM